MWSSRQILSLLAAKLPPKSIRRLIESCSYEEYLDASPARLRELGVDRVEPVEVELDSSITPLAITDPSYPTALLSVSAPPVILFVRGSLDALALGIAVVGTRKISELGLATTPPAIVGAGLLAVPVISGLATGVDSLAHGLAIAASLPTVAVLSTHPTHPSPSGNTGLAEEILATGGALVSEALPEITMPEPRRLMARNRIIVGLASTVVPAEFALRSGTSGTVVAALAAHRALVVPLPRPVAAGLPGAAGPLALSDPRGLNPKVLGLTGEAARLSTSYAPLANAVATSAEELTELVVLAHRFSSLH